MGVLKDKIGDTNGKLTVVSFNRFRERSSGKREAVWNCVCECGSATTVNGGNLKNTTSCGCSRNKRTEEEGTKQRIRIKIQCPIHGESFRSKSYRSSGNGCVRCAKRKGSLKPFSEFIEQVKLVQPKHFVFSEEDYNKNTKLTVTCLKHGNFEQNKPKSLAGQIGCVKCRQPIHDVNTFIEQAEKVHGKNYDYSSVKDVKNTRCKVGITCKKHGVFYQNVNAHLKGSGCTSCSTNGFNYQKEAVLYVLEIVTDSDILYKIGITNLTVDDRFLVRELKSVKVLYTEEFYIGRCAYVKEQKLIKLMKNYKYSGKHIFRRGNTEIVTVNPLLQLKEEFYGIRN